MRLKNVAVPAQAHVVDQIQIQHLQFGLGGLGAGYGRVSLLQPMQHNRQSLRFGRNILGDNVDFVPPGKQIQRVMVSPRFGAAPARVERFNRQGDFH